MSGSKNIAASVKARLQNLAAKRSEDFNLLLVRYGIERFLFRLSQSRHANRFLVKGAMLFVIWDEKTHRPTRDLDLLGFGLTDVDELVRIVREILGAEVAEDGIVFGPSRVRAEENREDNAYGGIRVRFLGKLGTAELPVQVDVGAGDVVTPHAEKMNFPALLDFPAPLGARVSGLYDHRREVRSCGQTRHGEHADEGFLRHVVSLPAFRGG